MSYRARVVCWVRRGLEIALPPGQKEEERRRDGESQVREAASCDILLFFPTPRNRALRRSPGTVSLAALMHKPLEEPAARSSRSRPRFFCTAHEREKSGYCTDRCGKDRNGPSPLAPKQAVLGLSFIPISSASAPLHVRLSRPFHSSQPFPRAFSIN